MKIVITGWQDRTKSVAEIVSYWPDELDKFLAVARAAKTSDVRYVEEVLVEVEEKENA